MMKLKKRTTETGQETKQQLETKHETLSRQGRNAKRKGGQFERDVAKKFQKRYGVELKRTPQSGGFAKKSEKADDFRGDITIVDTKQVLLLHIECKNQQKWSLPKWVKQAESDCPEGRVPIVVFHEHNTSNDYVTLKLEDFLDLVPKEKVIGRRTFKK